MNQDGYDHLRDSADATPAAPEALREGWATLTPTAEDLRSYLDLNGWTLPDRALDALADWLATGVRAATPAAPEALREAAERLLAHLADNIDVGGEYEGRRVVSWVSPQIRDLRAALGAPDPVEPRT